MTAESARPRKASNVTRPVLWVGSGNKTTWITAPKTQHNTTQHCTAYLKERIFVEVDWFQENITIMTLGLASTAVRGVRGREGE